MLIVTIVSVAVTSENNILAMIFLMLRSSVAFKWLPMSNPMSPRAIWLMKTSSFERSGGTMFRNDGLIIIPVVMNPTICGISNARHRRSSNSGN